MLSKLENIVEGNTKVFVDIGASTVKVAQFKRKKGIWVLTKIALRDIPLSELNNQNEFDVKVVSSILESIWKEFKIESREVKLLISDVTLYSRHITVPKVSEEELSKAIKWQAEKYIPFSVDEAIVDYQILDNRNQRLEGHVGIVVVALQKNIVEQYLFALKKAGLCASAIDATVFSLAKTVKEFHLDRDDFEGKVISLVDIGGRKTSIVIMKDGFLQFVRNVYLGGIDCTKAIFNQMRMDFQKAEDQKKKTSLISNAELSEALVSQIRSAIDPVLGELQSQINRSFAYFEGEHFVEGVDRMILCGGGSKLNGLDSVLTKKFGIDVEIASIVDNSIEVDNEEVAIELEKNYSQYLPVLFGGVREIKV